MMIGNLALKADGTAVAWGTYSVPVNLHNVIAIADGGSHSLAIVVPGQGAALDFDGGDDYVALPASLNNKLNGNAITVEGWFYPTGYGANNPGWISENYGNDSRVTFTLVQVNSTVECGFFDGAWQRANGVALTINAWQHIAYTYDRQTIKLYRNGLLAASLDTTAELPFSSDDWYLGQRWDLGSPYAGRMDEVRIWNRALSSSEISDGMNCEVGSGQTGLVAYYRFNQGISNDANPSVTTLNDTSGNSNTGALTNFTLSGSTSNWVAPGGVSQACTTATGANADQPPAAPGDQVAQNVQLFLPIVVR